MVIVQSRQSKGLIRSLNRGGVRDDKSPQVVRKTLPVHERQSRRRFPNPRFHSRVGIQNLCERRR